MRNDFVDNPEYYGLERPVKTMDLSAVLSNAMTGVYLYMFVGLVVTAACAFFASTNKGFLTMMVNEPTMLYGLCIVEILLVAVLSMFVRKVPAAVSFVFFMIYSAVNGLTLSVVFLVYDLGSIYTAFLTTALTFGVTSAIGFFTKKDLTTTGHYCMMGLIGIIIAAVVNIFIMSDFLSFGISSIGILIFVGLTAYDTQKIKGWLAEENNDENVRKICVYGALTLYLDFINIFLKLLRIMGKRKR